MHASDGVLALGPGLELVDDLRKRTARVPRAEGRRVAGSVCESCCYMHTVKEEQGIIGAVEVSPP